MAKTTAKKPPKPRPRPLVKPKQPAAKPGPVTRPPVRPVGPPGSPILPPKKAPRGRHVDPTDYGAERERVNQARKMERMGFRDIAPLPVDTINWDRRLACKESLKLFCETYLPAVFYLGWSEDQLKCLAKIETVFTKGGTFALAMPRGGGKTAGCRAGILWGTAYAFRRFPYFVGSSAPKSIQTLEFIKTYWYRSKELLEDFPEIAYPVAKIENRWHLARGQLFNGTPTFIEWGAETARYPCLILPDDVADVYRKRDPDSVRHVPNVGWIPSSGGIMIATAGIDGSIRGEAETHPITLEQPRPDLVLLDDIQKDSKAESPASCEKMVRLVDGAIQGLAGPGQHIAGLMPCTVIRKGDVADTYLDRAKKPEWKGERCRLVNQWPDGIDDFKIGMETPAGKLWNEYAELRKKSLRLYEDLRMATDFYLAHRTEMDRGFIVSWKDRYEKKTEASAQQHAMNLRLQSPHTFPAEFQNIGKDLTGEGPVLVSAAEVAEKTTALPRGHLPPEANNLVAFFDVQDEILFYTVLAAAPDFTSWVVDYGTWPQVPTAYFTKNQAGGWAMLSREFWKKYPTLRDEIGTKTAGNKIKPPLEAKIYHALAEATGWMMGREFIKEDGHATTLRVQRLGIDTRWGQASEAIKRFCRESPFREKIVPAMGEWISPAAKQFEEYTRTKGWLFEDQLNPRTKEVRWIYRPGADGQYVLRVDVSRMKTFLMARLASPPGSSGSMSLFEAPPEGHEMFADHVAGSEYPEPTTARGLTKDQWKVRDHNPDNDFLDCLVGCCSLASLQGACLKVNADGTAGASPQRRPRRKLSEAWQHKRGNQG